MKTNNRVLQFEGSKMGHILYIWIAESVHQYKGMSGLQDHIQVKFPSHSLHIFYVITECDRVNGLPSCLKLQKSAGMNP